MTSGAIPTSEDQPDQLTMAAPTDDTTAGGAGPIPGTAPAPIKAVPVRHPGRWVAIVVLAVLGAMLVNTILTNDGFRWDVVGKYLFSAPVLNGLRNTLILTVLSMADRHLRRHRAGDHAPVAEPGAQLRRRRSTSGCSAARR